MPARKKGRKRRKREQPRQSHLAALCNHLLEVFPAEIVLLLLQYEPWPVVCRLYNGFDGIDSSSIRTFLSVYDRLLGFPLRLGISSKCSGWGSGQAPVARLIWPSSVEFVFSTDGPVFNPLVKDPCCRLALFYLSTLVVRNVPLPPGCCFRVTLPYKCPFLPFFVVDWDTPGSLPVYLDLDTSSALGRVSLDVTAVLSAVNHLSFSLLRPFVVGPGQPDEVDRCDVSTTEVDAASCAHSVRAVVAKVAECALSGRGEGLPAVGGGV